MITLDIKKKTLSLLTEAYMGIGQEGFLPYLCEQYRNLMNFQCCHIVHLQHDGLFNFEYINNNIDYSGLLKYQHEDIWRPSNSKIPIHNVMHMRINKSLQEELSNKFNLYNWLQDNWKLNDSIGTIHPCYSSFTCFRLGEKQLSEDEYKYHSEIAERIIQLYYIDRQLNRGRFFEDLYLNHKHIKNDSPMIILNEDYQCFHEDKNFLIKLNALKLDYKVILQKIKYKTNYSKPRIIDFNEEFRFIEYSKNTRIEFIVTKRFYSKKIYYLCSFDSTDDNRISFTFREREILEMISEGVTNNEIAERLFISKDTVKKHLYNMMRKANSKNRVELIKHNSIQKNRIEH